VCDCVFAHAPLCLCRARNIPVSGLTIETDLNRSSCWPCMHQLFLPRPRFRCWLPQPT
jgi:hypothetical protein